MRTEITVPFAFDTAPIEEMLQKHGEEEAVRILREMVEKEVVSNIPKKYEYSYNSGKREPDWSTFLRREFQTWLSEHTAEIVDEAALMLAQRAAKRKSWKEALADAKREMSADD